MQITEETNINANTGTIASGQQDSLQTSVFKSDGNQYSVFKDDTDTGVLTDSTLKSVFKEQSGDSAFLLPGKNESVFKDPDLENGVFKDLADLSVFKSDENESILFKAFRNTTNVISSRPTNTFTCVSFTAVTAVAVSIFSIQFLAGQ